MVSPSRSSLTKERIKVAARTLFAAHGFDRTTVRGIAQEAGIHASLVIRYFESKENLFLESVDFNLQLPDLRAVPVSRRGERLMAHFLGVWETTESSDQLPALLRIALSHPNGRARMKSMFSSQLEPMLRHIVPAGEASTRAALIVSQTLGLALTRYVLALKPVVALTHEQIIHNVGRSLQKYLS